MAVDVVVVVELSVDDELVVMELVDVTTIGVDSTTRVLGSGADVTTLCNYLRKK